MKARQLKNLRQGRRRPYVGISNDISHSEVISRSRPIGRPLLRFNHKVKQDTKQLHQNNMYDIQVSKRQAWKKFEQRFVAWLNLINMENFLKTSKHY